MTMKTVSQLKKRSFYLILFITIYCFWVSSSYTYTSTRSLLYTGQTQQVNVRVDEQKIDKLILN